MPTIISAKSFTNRISSARRAALALVGVGALLVSGTVARADWSIDFSRRLKASRDSDLAQPAPAPAANTSTGGGADGLAIDRAPASATGEPAAPAAEKEKSKGLFDTLFDAGEPVQDLVILNTEHGFVPATVRVRKNARYRVSVVNVNEKEKNVSFILDGFSEHHATYYGKIKMFMLEPKKEGSYSFESPETSAEGKLIVFNPQISMRVPASEESAR